MESRTSDPNVLLVILDTVRARSTSFGDRDITPTLDRVATQGARFEEAIAPAPWTLSSHTSMFTGRYPTEHGVTRYNRSFPQDEEPLAAELNREGYATGLFTPNQFLTEQFGMTKGFERSSFTISSAQTVFDEAFDVTRFAIEHEHQTRDMVRSLPQRLIQGPVVKNAVNLGYFGLRSLTRNLPGRVDHDSAEWDRQAVDEASEFIRQHAGDRKFFTAVNLIEAHGPWPFDRTRLHEIGVDPEDVAPQDRWEKVAKHSADQWEYLDGEIEFDETDREILTRLYESWVHSVDGLASELLDVLDEEGVRDETLVIVTADHGECIAHDRVLGHELSVDRDATHVPLAVEGPGVSAETVADPVSLKDIYGTVLSAAGFDIESPSVFDERGRGVAFSETANVSSDRASDARDPDDERLSKQVALYTSEGRVERRYASDRVLGDEAILEELDAFVAQLQERSAAGHTEVEVEGKIKEQLEELGYLS